MHEKLQTKCAVLQISHINVQITTPEFYPVLATSRMLGVDSKSMSPIINYTEIDTACSTHLRFMAEKFQIQLYMIYFRPLFLFVVSSMVQ